MLVTCSVYEEVNESNFLEIFVLSTYTLDPGVYLGNKYNTLNPDVMKKYDQILKNKSKTIEIWNQFTKKAINYYIGTKKNLLVNHYQVHKEAYDSKKNLFNDNYIVDFKKKPIPNYWKVSYLRSRLPNKYIIVKELYKNNKLLFRVYYSELRMKLKEESFAKEKKRSTYYNLNKKIETSSAYEEVNESNFLEIFVLSSYTLDPGVYLGNKYNTHNPNVMRKYDQILKNKFKSVKTWNQFIKKAIDYYIAMKKDLVAKHYQVHKEAYDAKINLFKDDYIVDLKKKPISNYWKVFYLRSKFPKKFMIVKELYKNNKLLFRVHYSELRMKLKEDSFVKDKQKSTYYNLNKEIDE